MTSAIKNVILAGGTGLFGAPILKALLDEESLNVTILTRASSSAKFATGIPIKRVSDSFTVEELTEAFKGQDAVIVALAAPPLFQSDLAYRLVDAAVAAGIKRFVPSDFGVNNLDPRPRKLVPLFDGKGAALEYLQKKAAESEGRLTWTSFANGPWIDWALDSVKSENFLGIDVKNRKAVVYDSGDTRFSVTTLENTGLAVVRSLLIPSDTANKQIYVSDFVTSPREIIATLEKQTGFNYEIEQKQSEPLMSDLREKFDGGELEATYPLLALSIVGDVDIGLEFEKEQQVWNDKLGLPKVTLDGVVKQAIEVVNRT